MTSSTNKVIFFIMLGIFFIVFFFSTGFFYMHVNPESSFKRCSVVLVAAAVFSLFFVGYSQLTGLFKNEGFEFCPSPGPKLCRGGPYMWQGDSEIAKFCRNLASTPEGKAEIDSYECGTGYTGMPGGGFKDTPMSNGSWQNEMCS